MTIPEFTSQEFRPSFVVRLKEWIARKIAVRKALRVQIYIGGGNWVDTERVAEGPAYFAASEAERTFRARVAREFDLAVPESVLKPARSSAVIEGH